MKLKYTYWYFKSVLSDEFCKKVINLAKQKQKVMATIGSGELNKKTRDSLVLFLNDPIIYKTLHPYIQTANKNAEWNFQWDSTEPVQYTEYNKKQHYRWHQDAWDQPYVNPEEPLSYGKIRKISVSCSLNDSKKYKGGKLQFDSSTPLKKEDIIKKSDPGGFCGAWSLYFLDLKLSYPDYNTGKLLSKAFTALQKDKNSFRSFIRNYSNFIISQRSKLVKKYNYNSDFSESNAFPLLQNKFTEIIKRK